MQSDNRLINKAFVGIWMVNGVSTLFSIACVMIDAIIVGQFLGKEAVTATGLVQPVILMLNIVGGLLGPGLSIVCTRYMGMARKDLVNAVFSMIMQLTFMLGVFFSALLFIFAPAIAGTLGARADNPIIVSMAGEYLRWFALGTTPMWFSISLSGLMMVDNDRARSVLSMVVVLFTDFLFDYLNVTVFHGGMLGIALASVLSYTAGVIVVLTHFTKKDRVLRFSFTKFDMKEIKEVMRCSVSSSVNMGSLAIRGLCFNAFLLSISGAAAVAALTSTNSLFSILNAISVGIYVSSSALVSMLYGEGDKSGIIKAVKFSMKAAVFAMGLVAVIQIVFARAFAGIFLDPTAVEEIELAAVMIRFMAVQYLFTAITHSLCGSLEGIRKNIVSNIYTFLRDAFLQMLCCIILGNAYGLIGFDVGLCVSGFLTLLACFILPSIIKKKVAYKTEDIILLPDDFGVGKEDIFEASMTNMEEVVEVSRSAMEFCRNKNIDKRTSQMTALFIEETVGNTMVHKTGNEVIAELRVIYKDGGIVIRIRDNGKQFDPVEWYEKNHPEDPSSGLGIRMIMKLAKDVSFIPALGLNNLMITI